jgi:hypothetical protein
MRTTPGSGADGRFGLRYCQRVLADGLDAEKLDVLRRWGAGLQRDGREEVAAAGRAILLLIDEIERLHVLVWDRKLYPDAPIAAPSPAADAAGDGGEDAPPENLSRTLRDRLRRARRDRFSTA